MASLSASSKNIVLSFPDKIIVFHQIDRSCFESEVLYLSLNNPTNSESQKTNDHETFNFVCSAVSKSGKYFINCSYKNVTLWETSSWTVVGVIHLSRAASCACFSERDDYVVVADKSGDVYSYKLDNFGKEAGDSNQLILGHVSMLLRVAVSPDDKHIVTCDRDEKIRISRFPDSYNVTSYCLGHTESVTCLSFLTNRPDELLSGSSDGTVRLWKYIDGKQLLQHNLNRGNENFLILDLNAIHIDDNKYLVCVIAHMIKGITLLAIDYSGSTPLCASIKNVALPCLPRSLVTVDKRLYVLSYDSPHFLTAYDCLGNTLSPSESLNDNLTSEMSKYLDDFKTICCNLPDERLLAYFNKRKIDDTQEYHRRKKERLLGQIDKSKVNNLINYIFVHFEKFLNHLLTCNQLIQGDI